LSLDFPVLRLLPAALLQEPLLLSLQLLSGDGRKRGEGSVKDAGKIQ
jgi:hypothetical protein